MDCHRMTTLAQTRDPWSPHASKGKGHPVVPEPAVYGALLMGACLLAWVMRRPKT